LKQVINVAAAGNSDLLNVDFGCNLVIQDDFQVGSPISNGFAS
jgi:hypothetical protein